MLIPALGHPGRPVGQPHGQEVLAEKVIDGVEQPVAGQGTPGSDDPFFTQRPVEHGTRGSSEQGAIQIDEDGTHALEATNPGSSDYRA